MQRDGFRVGRYRLTSVDKGRVHYAEVTVAARPSSTNAVTAGAAPFSWNIEAYGPFAKSSSMDPVYVAEALDGVRLALDELNGFFFDAVVVEIRETLVDTHLGDVRYAAAHALWRAVGFDRVDLRTVRNGRLVLPDEVNDEPDPAG